MRRAALTALIFGATAGCVPLDLGEYVLDVPLDSDTDTDTDTDTGVVDTAPPLPTEVFVPMEGLAFVEPEVTIPVGGTVTWSNNDTAFHIIAAGTPEDLGEWASDEILFGDSWSMTFEEVGDVIYFCDNHSRTMRDAIIHVVP